MKKRKATLKELKVNQILNHEVLKVTKEADVYFFEIGNETTCDLAEAVAILMRKADWNDNIWNTEIDKEINVEDLTPEKALFWLTGGYSEWRTLNNYAKPWCDCYLDFQEEFGFIIVNIVKKSKTLLDIRNGFVKYLNLPTLYNFAISREMIK